MDSREHIQCDNELDSDFEEDKVEVENEEVDEDKGQISASCCFCCTLSMVESFITCFTTFTEMLTLYMFRTFVNQ